MIQFSANAVPPKTGEPKARSFTVAHRVSDRFTPVVARSFVGAIGEVKARIDMNRLTAVIESGASLEVIVAEVQTGPIAIMQGAGHVPPQFFRLLEQALLRAGIAVGEGSAEIIAEATGVEFEFNASDPTTILFAREQGARLVSSVTDDVKAAIAEVVGLAAEHGLTPAQQAEMIRLVVGLQTNHMTAPLNFANELRLGQVDAAVGRLMGDPLLEPRKRAADAARMETEIRVRIETNTVTDVWIAEMQERYARNLLHRRALNIARVETMRAANHGLRESWRQAVRQGVLPKLARRVVIVTPDERLRESHLQAMLMNPEGVGIDDKFQTPWGLQAGPPWDADPYNCRCSEGIVFPGLEGAL